MEILSGESSVGSSKVSISIQSNAAAEGREATLTIAGKEVSVIQAGHLVTVDNPIDEISREQNSWPITVEADDGVTWSVSSDSAWLTVNKKKGTGSDQVLLKASENTGRTRTAVVTVGGRAFTVTQTAAIGWIEVDTTPFTFEFPANEGAITLETDPTTSWTAKSSAEWLTLKTASGKGNKTIEFSVDVNTTGNDRSGTITIGEYAVTVTQLGTRTMQKPRVVGQGCINGELDTSYRADSYFVAVPSAGYVFDHWVYVWTNTSAQTTHTSTYTTRDITVTEYMYLNLTAYFVREQISDLASSNAVQSVNLAWADATWATKYRIYRSEGSTKPDDPIAEISASPNPAYIDTSSEMDVSYNYWIEAVDAKGGSSVTGPITGKRNHVATDVFIVNGPQVLYAGESRVFEAGYIRTDGKIQYVYSGNVNFSMSPSSVTGVSYKYQIGKGDVVTVADDAPEGEVTIKLSLKDSETFAELPVKIIPKMSVEGLGTLMFEMRLESQDPATESFITMEDGQEVARIAGNESKMTELEYSAGGYHEISWKTQVGSWSGYIRPAAAYGLVTNLVWTPAPAEVTLSFDAQGGECDVVTKKYATGTLLGELPRPTRAGYDFAGWFFAHDDTKELTSDSYAPVNDYALNAHWTPCHYTVEFDLGEYAERMSGGALMQSVAYLEAAVAPMLKLQTGYEFTGWSADFSSITGPLVVKADYRPIPYTLSYADTKGAANDNPATYTVEDEVRFAPLADVPGWKFLGWNPSSIDAGSIGNRTITAEWEQVMCRFEFTGGETRDFAYGETITLSSAASITNGWTNLVCKGWIGTGDVPASGTMTSATFTVKEGGSIQWLFDTNFWFEAKSGNGGSVALVNGPTGTDLDGCWLTPGVTVELSATPEGDNHLVRWNNAAAADQTIDVETRTFTVDAPLVLTAVFSDTYIITFDVGMKGERTGGGALQQEIRVGESATPPEITAKPGYRFVGWDHEVGSIASDLLVKANYETIDYALEYVDTKGCENGNIKSYTVEDTVRFSALTNPPGWKFLGWEPSEILVGSTENKQITAQWQQLKYAVDIDGVVDEECVYGQQVTASTFESLTENGTNIVCTGWLGSGDVPVSGTDTQVTFTVTQPSTVRWLYETNYLAQISHDGHGTVSVTDVDAEPCEFSDWWMSGTLLNLSATPQVGYTFGRWIDAATGSTIGTTADLQLCVNRALSVRAEFTPITYIVRIHAREGEGSTENQTVRYGGDAAVNAGSIFRKGYVLAGWTADPDGVEAQFGAEDAVPNLTTMANATIDLYAVWRPVEYKISFTAGLIGAEGEMSNQLFVYGEEQALASNNFSRAGYVFCGWKATVGGLEDVYEDGELLTNPGWYEGFQELAESSEEDCVIELLGVWKRRIVFNKDGGTGGTDEIVVAVGEGFPAVEPPVKPGYLFKGYTSKGRYVYYSGGSSSERLTDLYADYELTAYWQKMNNDYYIYYQGLAGCGYNSDKNPKTYNVWDEDILLADPTPLKGYRFDCWLPTNTIPKFSTGSKTFTARWIKLKTVKITYDLGCDDAHPAYATYKYDRQEVVEGGYEGESLKSLLTPVRDGYTFCGWYSSPDEGELYEAGFDLVDDLTMYAHWAINSYVVHFDANGGDGEGMEDIHLVYGESRQLPSNQFTRAGYEFYGWQYERSTGGYDYIDDGAVVSNLTTAANGEVTLRAYWTKPSYTITYHGYKYDGSGCESVAVQTDMALWYLNSRWGYEPQGWSLEPGGLVVAACGAYVSTITSMTHGDTDLYAVWKPIEYTVQFEGNGGSGYMEPIQMSYGTEYQLPACSFVLEGWEFDYWLLYTYDYESNSGKYTDGAMVSNFVGQLTITYGLDDGNWNTIWHENIPCNPRLVAQWRKKTCPVTVGDKESRYEYGSSVTLTAPGTGLQEDGSRVVCVGWEGGTGDFPTVGMSDSVQITVTQASALKWLYEIEYVAAVNSKLGDGTSAYDPVSYFAKAYIEEISSDGAYQYWDYFGANDTVTFVAPSGVAAEYGYEFIGWAYRENMSHGGEMIEPQEGIRFESDEENGCERLIVDGVCEPLYVAAVYAPIEPAVTFDLGEHGTRIGGGELVQTIWWNGTAVAPKVSVDSAYTFTGWSCSLDHIKEDVTIVAQYTKIASKIDVECANGCNGMGSVSGGKTVKTGAKVTLKATASKGCVFAGWYSDAGGANPLAGDIDYRTASYNYVATGEDVAFYAKFISTADDRAKMDFVSADEFATGEAIEPIVIDVSGCTSLPTVKVTGLPTGLKFTAKALDVKATKSTPAAHYEANTIYGTPTKSGVYTVVVSVTTAGKKTASKSAVIVVRKANEKMVKINVADLDGKVPGTVKGAGIYAGGKKVSLTATANKGFVFAGWWIANGKLKMENGELGAGNLVSKAASYSFVMGSDDLVFDAAFITSETDKANIALAVNGNAISAATAFATNLYCGVAVNWPIIATALSDTTVKATGLPSGLKLVQDKTTKAYSIAGVPTAASKTDKNGNLTPSAAKFTVTTAGKSSQTFVMNIAVAALPNWAVGTYQGAVTNDVEIGGLVDFTVTAAGKISGKANIDGNAWTLAATSYEAVETSEESGEAIGYYAVGTAKLGKTVEEFRLEVTEDGFSGAFGDYEFYGYRSAWKDAGAKAELKTVFAVVQNAYKARGEKNVTIVTENGLTLKLANTGTVTISGTLNGYKVSASAVLLNATLNAATPSISGTVMIYVPPKTGKFAGYCSTEWICFE